MKPFLQAVKLSADPRNSAFFRGFVDISEISANLLRNLKGCVCGGGGLTQEVLGPQKWFTYQNLQNFTRKCMKVFPVFM